jgi:prepilin-type N-terminal cleavage/methylation domain-containing protein
MKRSYSKKTAFTLVELAVAAVILAVVAGIAYSILMGATTLLAKNVSLNSSNTLLRASLDRIYAEVSQGNGMPTLINADGSPAGGSGPAAGIVFDRYLGGPYIVTPGGPNGLGAAAKSVQLTFSTDPFAAPPTPQSNDVLCIGDSTLRPLVNSMTASTPPGHPSPDLVAVNVNLQAKLGQDIPWTSAVEEKAFLVHRKAVVVVQTNGRNELRLYSNVETLHSTCDLTTSYIILNREIGTAAGEEKPFTLVTENTVTFLAIAMHVEAQQFGKVLTNRQAKQFNTFLEVNGRVRPRNFL